MLYLEGLPGVKDNGLTVRKEIKDGVTLVYVVDRDGKVVRRIPESELAGLSDRREKKSGQLLACAWARSSLARRLGHFCPIRWL